MVNTLHLRRDQLRRHMRRAGLQQQDLCRNAAISAAHVSRVINGLAAPSAAFVAATCDQLGMSSFVELYEVAEAAEAGQEVAA